MGFTSRLQVRARVLRAGLASAAVVIAAGAAAVARWPNAGWWLTILTAVITAGVPVSLSALTAAMQRRTDTAKVTRQAVQGVVGIKLPMVKEAKDLDTRVHRAVLPIPYIRRDAEGEARSHLEAGQPLLLVGSSMVGKTRMAVSFIRGMFADRTLVMPDSMSALASLDAADVELRGAVIFLDDVNRLVGAGGITDGTLLRLGAAGNVIVASIGAADYDRYQPTPLPALAEPHLTGSDHLDLSDKQAYKAAMHWATRDINPTVALLRRDEQAELIAFTAGLLRGIAGGTIEHASYET